MIYLKSVYYKDKELPNSYPFNIAALKSLEKLEFNSQVTFFVGENGSGKSTLLEIIASGMNAVAVGSSEIQSDNTLAGIRHSSNFFRFSRKQQPKQTLFFRAEDAFGFTRRVMQLSEDLADLEQVFVSEIKSEAGRDQAVIVARGERAALERVYGENPDAKSHGESFMNILQRRIRSKYLCLLDEPETPLSPVRQLALMSLMNDYIEQGVQFIIATHSPILMAFPGADIYTFDDGAIQLTPYDEVEHVSVTRSFLKNPELYLSRL